MIALRRKTKIRGRPMQALDLNVMCDVCGKARSHGNHRKCSAERQRRAQEKRDEQ